MTSPTAIPVQSPTVETAAPSQLAAPDRQSIQFLSFRVSPTTPALISTQAVQEILNLSLNQIVPIPDVPAAVMGICNYRGEILWLVDLRHLLGFEPLYSQGYHQTNYTAIAIRHGDDLLGLVVDQVQQMVWCDPGQFQSLPPTQVTPQLSRCLQGYWLNQTGQPYWVLNSDRIFQACQAPSP